MTYHPNKSIISGRCAAYVTGSIVPSKQRNKMHPVTTEEKVDVVARHVWSKTNVSLYMMRRRTRKREVVFARMILFYLCHHWNLASYSKLGKLYGDLDHTTAIHGKKTMQDLIDTNCPGTEWVTEARERGFTALL